MEATCVPAMILLGVGLGISFVPITIAGTSGVAPEDSGLASGLLNTTQQVGGSLGLAILSSVATQPYDERAARRLGAAGGADARIQGRLLRRPGFCRRGRRLVDRAAAWPPTRTPADEHVQTVALSFARFPGAPHWGHHARVVAFGRRHRDGSPRP